MARIATPDAITQARILNALAEAMREASNVSVELEGRVPGGMREKELEDYMREGQPQPPWRELIDDGAREMTIKVRFWAPR